MPPVAADRFSALAAGAIANDNALLQGQFHHSGYRLNEGQLNAGLAEAWAGVEWRLRAGWELRYLVRWETPELRSGIGSRSIVWGSAEISKNAVRD